MVGMSAADVFEAARLYIERHGIEAEQAAAQRAQSLLNDGDTVGSAVWLRIAGAIREIEGKDGETPLQ